MRIAIVGSRAYPAENLVREFVLCLAKRKPDTVILSGGARGVDTWAAEAARAGGLTVEVYPPDWDNFGKKAGFLRNSSLVQLSEMVVGFWNLSSRGTMDTMRKALKWGRPLHVFGPTGLAIPVDQLSILLQ